MAKKVVPMLHVPDVRRTVDWYRELGFEVTVTYGDGGEGQSFAMVAFGSGEVMFSSGGKAERVGGIKYTIKDGIVYDARQLLADVASMVEKQKKERAAKTGTSAAAR